MLSLSRHRALATAPKLARGVGVINVHTAGVVGRRRAANAAFLGTRSIYQSLLHGSPEAKAAGDAEIQQHTKLVARGKYVHSFEGACELWTRRQHALTVPIHPIQCTRFHRPSSMITRRPRSWLLCLPVTVSIRLTCPPLS